MKPFYFAKRKLQLVPAATILVAPAISATTFAQSITTFDARFTYAKQLNVAEAVCNKLLSRRLAPAESALNFVADIQIFIALAKANWMTCSAPISEVSTQTTVPSCQKTIVRPLFS
jgi:hypothetical protein